MATTSGRERPRFAEEGEIAVSYKAAHLQRVVNVYPLAENELDHIGNVNGLAALFFSVGLALASVAASFWIAGATAGDNVDERAEAIFDVVPILSVIFAILAFGASALLWQSSRSTLNRLKKECRRPSTIVTPSPVITGDIQFKEYLQHEQERVAHKRTR